MQRRRLRRLQRRSLLLTECFRVFGFSAQRPALGRIRLWQRVRTVFLPECGALCPVRIPVGRLRYAVRTRADFGRPFRPAGYGRSGRFWRDRTGVFGAVRWRCAPVPVGATAVYGTSEDGLSSFGRLSEGFRYPAAANRGKLIIFIAVSVSVGMYPTVRPFNGERL